MKRFKVLNTARSYTVHISIYINMLQYVCGQPITETHDVANYRGWHDARAGMPPRGLTWDSQACHLMWHASYAPLTQLRRRWIQRSVGPRCHALGARVGGRQRRRRWLVDLAASLLL